MKVQYWRLCCVLSWQIRFFFWLVAICIFKFVSFCLYYLVFFLIQNLSFWRLLSNVPALTWCSICAQVIFTLVGYCITSIHPIVEMEYFSTRRWSSCGNSLDLHFPNDPQHQKPWMAVFGGCKYVYNAAEGCICGQSRNDGGPLVVLHPFCCFVQSCADQIKILHFCREILCRTEVFNI